jgi:hypothetical protein
VCNGTRVVNPTGVAGWTLVSVELCYRESGSGKKRVTKLERAHDGCLGDRRRRRTRVAAISFGEPLTRL